MHFGYTTYSIRLFGLNSIKDKRSIVKRTLNYLRKTFNASVVETGKHDSKDWLEITVGLVTNDRGQMDSLFASVDSRLTEYNHLDITFQESEVW